MSDNIVLAKAPRPQHNWFSSTVASTAPITDVLGAFESSINTFSPSAAESASMQAEALLEPVNSADVVNIEQPSVQVQPELKQGSPIVEDLDFELIVGSLLDDISSVMDDIRENRMTLSDQLVDLIAKSFEDIARHIEHVPQHLAIEVGELGAEICDVIEANGTSAQPIIALFNP